MQLIYWLAVWKNNSGTIENLNFSYAQIVIHAPPSYAELSGFVPMLPVQVHVLYLCFPPKGCVRTLLAPMQALSRVSMPPKPFRYMPWVSFDHPGRPLYYCVRTSATVQPTQSVQCNPTVEAEV